MIRECLSKDFTFSDMSNKFTSWWSRLSSETVEVLRNIVSRLFTTQPHNECDRARLITRTHTRIYVNKTMRTNGRNLLPSKVGGCHWLLLLELVVIVSVTPNLSITSSLELLLATVMKGIELHHKGLSLPLTTNPTEKRPDLVHWHASCDGKN